VGAGVIKVTLPSAEYLREALAYDPASGTLTWLERPRSHFSDERSWKKTNSRMMGKPAFSTPSNNGYFVGTIDGRRLVAHRVAYTIFHGSSPEGEIDHSNGNRRDNRIANLRDVSSSENRRNGSLSRRSSSGITGVTFNTQKRRWKAHITIGNTNLHLGYFATKDEAAQARRDAARRHGFAPQHGKPQCR